MIEIRLTPEDFVRVLAALRCYRHVPAYRTLHDRLTAEHGAEGRA